MMTAWALGLAQGCKPSVAYCSSASSTPQAWLLAGELEGAACAAHEDGKGGGGRTPAAAEDMEPEALADAGSRFADCGGGIIVHYSVALPSAGASGASGASGGSSSGGSGRRGGRWPAGIPADGSA